jgi:hypothetical protein
MPKTTAKTLSLVMLSDTRRMKVLEFHRKLADCRIYYLASVFNFTIKITQLSLYGNQEHDTFKSMASIFDLL